MSPASPSPAPFVSHDDRFADVIGAAPRLVRVAVTDAHEGPVYVPGEDVLYFTSVPRVPGVGPPQVSIKRVALDGEWPAAASVVVASANVANGMTLSGDGRLIVCEQGTLTQPACIASLDPVSGRRETVVDGLDGRQLNSPNDVVSKSDETIWFTDPSYGHLQGFRPRPALPDAVYRYDPAADRLSALTDSLDKPNGLAFSPDERTLYLTDSGANQEPGSFHPERPHHVVAFDLADDGTLRNERVVAEIDDGQPDGIKVDSAGRLYVSSPTGVRVFDPEGDRLGEIQLPGAVNFTFGGEAGNVLFITTDTAIWGAVLQAAGPSLNTIRAEPALKGA